MQTDLECAYGLFDPHHWLLDSGIDFVTSKIKTLVCFYIADMKIKKENNGKIIEKTNGIKSIFTFVLYIIKVFVIVIAKRINRCWNTF